MRTTAAVFGVLVASAMATPAMAQSGATTILGGVSPAKLTQKPVDTRNVIAPKPAIAAQQNRFNFSQIFAKFPLPTFPSKRGLSPQPLPSTFPSTSYNPFKMLGKPPVLIGDPKTTAMPINVPTPFIPTVNSPVGPGSQ